MQVSGRQLNRATLKRQLLLERAALPVTDAVQRVVALQAQEPASPYLALWSRVAGFDPAELDRAFASRTVVKASLMRGTLHAVHAEDHPGFHAAMAPSLRASRLFDRRFRGSGLTETDMDALESELLASSTRPRTTVEMQAWLGERLGERGKRAWWAYRTYAALCHVPTGGPWSYGSRSSFAAAPTTLPRALHEASVRTLVARYLRGFGPATVQDVAQFTLLRRTVIRAAVAALGDEVVRLDGPDGTELIDVADAVIPGEAPAPPRLLPMWESVLLAYADRSRIVPSAYRSLVTRRNGDVLPTILVDGYVAGVWRALDGGIEITAFEPLDADAWEGLAAEASSLLALLAGRDPAVYRRYAHWWDELPSAERRLLSG